MWCHDWPIKTKWELDMKETPWFVCKMWTGEWSEGGSRKDYEGIEMIWSGYVMATDRSDARKKGKAEAAKAARKSKKEKLAP